MDGVPIISGRRRWRVAPNYTFMEHSSPLLSGLLANWEESTTADSGHMCKNHYAGHPLDLSVVYVYVEGADYVVCSLQNLDCVGYIRRNLPLLCKIPVHTYTYKVRRRLILKFTLHLNN